MKKGGEMYRRRGMPVDIELEDAGHRAPQENASNADADHDRLENLRKHSDPKAWSGAEPNRSTKNESGQKP